MSLEEKTPLLEARDAVRVSQGGIPQPKSRPLWPRICLALIMIAAVVRVSAMWYFIAPYYSYWSWLWGGDGGALAAQQCRQAPPMFPTANPSLVSMDEFLASPQFFNASVSRMSGAVQIPTESYDDMGPIGDDTRWDAMYKFAAYLEDTFPLVYRTLDVERINTHGLLYTWAGSDAALKPTVLMAHQDVVPVEKATVGQWTYPPYSGAFDGRFVWGRGASDTKNSLIAILEAVELLIDAGFTPQRSLVLSFGFDEEISGREGAGHLSQAILARYGPDGAAIIVDEGNGITEHWGTLMAEPAVAEKGYLDVDVIVRMPGGHSSVPPAHNGIGVMGALISQIEAHLYEPHLHDENPYLGQLYCGAAHAEKFPRKLRHELSRRKSTPHGKDNDEVCPAAKTKDRLALEAAKQSDAIKYLFTTSVAPDLIHGGAKINALPERTVLTVNHRVNVGDRTAHVRSRLTQVAGRVAKQFNLTLHAFPEDAAAGGETPNSITLAVAYQSTLEPAPVSPTDVGKDGLTAYGVLAGTTRALYGEDLVMVPGLSTGNTDTRYYWDLTRNIYRYTPAWDAEDGGSELGGVHTVDERISMRAHVAAVQWFSLFVRNMDEADV